MNLRVAELPKDEEEVLRALQAALRADPTATCFEHDDRAVRQLGACDEVVIDASRETLRRLNHRGLLRFDRSKGPRWVFELDPRAPEFTP